MLCNEVFLASNSYWLCDVQLVVEVVMIRPVIDQ